VVKRFGMPINHPTVALLFVLQDSTALFVYLTACKPSCRPNATAQAIADALIGARLSTRAIVNPRAAMHPRAQLRLSSISQMNLPSSLSTDSSGGQQASAVHQQPEQQGSPVHLQPGQQGTHQLTHLRRSGAAPAIHDDTPDGFADFMQVQAGRLQAGAATGSANRCASNLSSSLPSSQLVLPHEVAQGGCCLHDKCVTQNSCAVDCDCLHLSPCLLWLQACLESRISNEHATGAQGDRAECRGALAACLGGA